jgi:uncharacterized membrane protein YeaQ/YmgE (transglycosylase-associated protein family)
MGFIGFIIVGLVAGFIARAVVPGKDHMGIIATIILGMIGSLIGGVLGSLVQDGPVEFTTSGVIGSIIGAIIALLVWRKVGDRSHA